MRRWSMMKFNKLTAILIVIILASIALISMPLWEGDRDTHFTKQSPVPVYGYKIINIYPHDKAAYTQGLVYDGQNLYESTGLYGNSTVRLVELETGKIQQSYSMPVEYFGEGMTIWKNRLIQLTWKSMRGFVYNKSDFKQIRDFYYEREGWGITSDGLHLIMSDGSDTLYFVNPDSFTGDGSIRVKDSGKPVSNLNELEYINGSILANVYFDNKIAIISPETGEVTGWIDLQGLTAREKNLSKVDVLNGIAFNPKNDTILVTGKLWPELFEIEIQREGRQVHI
jgi:glutaminyl-peptide cyclotransferase